MLDFVLSGVAAISCLQIRMDLCEFISCWDGDIAGTAPMVVLVGKNGSFERLKLIYDMRFV